MQDIFKLGDHVRRIDGKCGDGMVVGIFDRFSGQKPTADDLPEDTRIAVRLAWPEDPADDEWPHQEPVYWELIADDRKKV